MKAHFVEVQKNCILEVKEDKRNEVFTWGADNSAPTLFKTLINCSPTAKECSKKFAKAILGGGFGEAGEIEVNKKGQTLNEVLSIISREFSSYGNAFIQIGYNGNLEYNSIVVVPSEESRVGKSDDLGYSGKIAVYNNWNKRNGRFDADNIVYYDSFSKTKAIAEAQVEAVGGIENWKGQIFHLKNSDSEIYSYADVFSVLGDCLLEKESQEFRHTGAVDGFLNSKILAVKPFKTEEDKNSFVQSLRMGKGAKGNGSVLLLESQNGATNPKDDFMLDDLSKPYDDKLFRYSDEKSERMICRAFGVPFILVGDTQSGIFGNSGELIKQAKIQLWEDKQEERRRVEAFLSFIMSRFETPVKNLKILNPFETIKKEVRNE